MPASKVGAELLFDVISTAYERSSVIVTTNLPFEEWKEVLGSERLTGATLDRLTHRCTILETGRESYRLREARRGRRKSNTEEPESGSDAGPPKKKFEISGRSAFRPTRATASHRPSHKGLEKDTGIKSQTLDSLLWALDNGKRQLQPNSVVVFDEAGMVGTKHMARLLEHVANVPGSRLTLVGDAKQLQPGLRLETENFVR